MEINTDLFDVQLDLKAMISFDWARIRGDKIYQQFLITDPETAFLNYIGYYLSIEKLFTYVPSTNGPGHYVSFSVLNHN